MKPVVQTKLRPPDGNCHAACIASILELPIDAVPSIYDGAHDEGYDRVRSWQRQRRWLAEMGLSLLNHERTDDAAEDWPGWRPDGYWIATHEQPPEAICHSTVWKGNSFVWNPYPGEGETETPGPLVMMEWFECLNPALLARKLPSRWRRATGITVTIHPVQR